MRRTITISVSEEIHELIHQGMRRQYYSTVSEYIRYLVRRDQPSDVVPDEEPEFEMPRTANEIIRDELRKQEIADRSRERW